MAEHHAAAFRQFDDKRKLELVRRIHETALRILGESIPPGLDLNNIEHAYVFHLKPSSRQLDKVKQSATLLVRYWAEAEENGVVTDLLWERILSAYRNLDSKALEVGRSRQKQVTHFSVLGSDARRKYSEEDKERWRQLAKEPQIARLETKIARARAIARREGLPDEAIETIRKTI